MNKDRPLTLEGPEPTELTDFDDLIGMCFSILYVGLFVTGLVSAFHIVRWIVGEITQYWASKPWRQSSFYRKNHELK